MTVAAAAMLMAASGVGDAWGFRAASRAWSDGSIVWGEVGQSVVAFTVGIGCFLLAVRPLQDVGIDSAATQSLIWFAVTVVGVAILDGSVRSWDAPAVIAGVVAVVSLATVIARVE